MKTRTLAGCRSDVRSNALARLLHAVKYEAAKMTTEQYEEALRLLARAGYVAVKH